MYRIIPDGRTIRVQSELDRRLRLALDRIVKDESFDDAFILEDIAHVPGYNRQFEDRCGDISGRYIGALALCSTYTGKTTRRCTGSPTSYPATSVRRGCSAPIRRTMYLT